MYVIVIDLLLLYYKHGLLLALACLSVGRVWATSFEIVLVRQAAGFSLTTVNLS